MPQIAFKIAPNSGDMREITCFAVAPGKPRENPGNLDVALGREHRSAGLEMRPIRRRDRAGASFEVAGRHSNTSSGVT